jgi:hypothetical protein
MKMFLSIDQIRASLPFLEDLNPFFGMSFLAFKKTGIPIGQMRRLVFSRIVQKVLDRHYKPLANYSGFYNPFKTSDQSNRWLAPRYGSTSLQRITSDTFSDSLLHTKGEPSWGWRHDYIRQLQKHLGRHRISAFHLAVWLFRDSEWPEGAGPEDLIRHLESEYRLTVADMESLFDETILDPGKSWLTPKPVSEAELLSVIGSPPGWAPPAGAALRQIQFREVGPTKLLTYEPAERLNVITGNNSLGKTFLLESLWWALTGDWLEYAAIPSRDVGKAIPKISFSLTSPSGRTQGYVASYNWDRQSWAVVPPTRRLPGLVIYARFDGSFAILDPARTQLADNHARKRATGPIFLTRKQIWDGTQGDIAEGKETWVCNGLLRDWISWQTGGELYQQHYSAFVSSLYELSPSESELLVPGEPMRRVLDSRSIPTLRMPYGEVQILHTSAAVQRIVALAYTLVWAWQEHLVSSSIIRREPQRYLVLIIDEVEAHLHPLWQRLIVPAIMRVVTGLSSSVKTQLHIATHSPLVLASAETVFDASCDNLHHLKMVDRNVVMEELPFVRRGRADLWLVSDVFGMGQARSLPAERAIEEAKALQMAKDAPAEKVSEVHARLISLLAPDDDFWPRWRYFAQQRSVTK